MSNRLKFLIAILVLVTVGFLSKSSWLPGAMPTADKQLLVGPFYYGLTIFDPNESGAPKSKISNSYLAPDEFILLLSGDRKVAGQKLAQIESNWDEKYVSIMVDIARFAHAPQREAIIDLLKRKTNQSFEDDLDAWRRWNWSRAATPYPDLARFKALLYELVDPRFTNFFHETESALIGLDKIQWGSVKPDSIPPLKSPEMLAAADVTFLEPSNIVFGVIINGDARCYPKRILAWHEMFEDTVGGETICGVY